MFADAFPFRTRAYPCVNNFMLKYVCAGNFTLPRSSPLFGYRGHVATCVALRLGALLLRSVYDYGCLVAWQLERREDRDDSFSFSRGSRQEICGPACVRGSKLPSSLKCYTDRHGYDLHVFPLRHERPVRCQAFSNVFFKKHCIVAQFLEEQPDGYAAVVLDADVTAVTLDRGLEKWLGREADLQFYSKDHNNRTPPLTFRTYQILPHTNSYFHCLYSLSRPSPVAPRVPGGLCPPGVPQGPLGEKV